MVITSKDNEKIKYLKKLKNNKFMNEEKKFIIEGDHLTKEAFKAGILLETYSVFDTDFNVPNTFVSKGVIKSLSTLNTPSNIIGVCKFIDSKIDMNNNILILDGVQDPGNLGTIIRSSSAFNFNTIVVSKDTVSKYNDKVIRATQGMMFKTNIIEEDLKTFIPYLKEHNYTVYGTNVNNGIDVRYINKNAKIAVIMGNEGQGVSNEVLEEVKDNIYIDLKKDVESLNVAVAASIIMYEINKGE